MAFEIIHMRPDRNGMYRILAMEDSKLAELQVTDKEFFAMTSEKRTSVLQAEQDVAKARADILGKADDEGVK